MGKDSPTLSGSEKRSSSDCNLHDQPHKKKFQWFKGLLHSMNDPESVIEKDERVVIIKDKYPKAKHHYLVLPQESLKNLDSLKSSHYGLIEHMEKKAHALTAKYPDIEFRYGFHAVPSMSQLHLHVISQDFISPCLKTKKHWNSFNTPFFIDSSEIKQMLNDKICIPMDKSCIPMDKSCIPMDKSCIPMDKSCIPMDKSCIPMDKSCIPMDKSCIPLIGSKEADESLKRPLQCHKCSFTPSNIPKLKEHILGHFSS